MLGNRIKQIRVSQRMTQKELADRLNVSKSTIGMWENNKREPDLNTIQNIAFALGCHLYDLIETNKIILDYKNIDAIKSLCKRSFASNKDASTAEMIINEMFDLNSSGLEKLLERVRELNHLPQYTNCESE